MILDKLTEELRKIVKKLKVIIALCLLLGIILYFIPIKDIFNGKVKEKVEELKIEAEEKIEAKKEEVKEVIEDKKKELKKEVDKIEDKFEKAKKDMKNKFKEKLKNL